MNNQLPHPSVTPGAQGVVAVSAVTTFSAHILSLADSIAAGADRQLMAAHLRHVAAQVGADAELLADLIAEFRSVGRCRGPLHPRGECQCGHCKIAVRLVK